MKKKYWLAPAGVSLLLFLNANLLSSAKAKQPIEDPLGRRFLCNDAFNQLCLPALIPGCHLILRAGPGIPSKPGEKATLQQNNETNIVDNPDQFKGCVEISTAAQAIEYLRFFLLSEQFISSATRSLKFTLPVAKIVTWPAFRRNAGVS